MIVSPNTVYQWAQNFSTRQGSDRFSQQAREIALEVMQKLERSPSVVVEAPYKINWMASDDEAVAWLQKIKITVSGEK